MSGYHYNNHINDDRNYMHENIFGTDGIRATMGNFPFTIDKLHHLGKAIARWSLEKYGSKPKLLLAHDTRISSSLVKSTIASGLLLYPLQLHDGGVLPSPAVLKIIQNNPDFNFGMIISASHNPFQDNGIKIIDAQIGKISLDDELYITSLFYKELSHDYATFGNLQYWPIAKDEYIQSLYTFFPSDFLKGKTIVLDCAHGAAFHIAPQVFEYFGATIIKLNCLPNGININKQCGALHTEEIQKMVVNSQADAGFAFDGDADRVIAINRYGQIKNGDDLLILLLDHPLYKNSHSIVGTIMTNQALELYLKEKNVNLIRTPVGDKYITDSLQEHSLLLGGEPSGHIIARDYLATGDGIFTALRALETIIITDNWDMITFSKFPQIIINVPIITKKDLTTSPFAEIIEESKKKLLAGRLIVRYSGTESLLRIMIEDQDFEYAQSVGSHLAKSLQQKLS